MPPIQSFARMCTLPHKQREAAKSRACHFSCGLHAVLMNATPQADAENPQTDGDFATTIKVAGHVIEVRAVFGQNMAVKNGVKAKFFSYSVNMDLRSPAIERVGHMAETAPWLGLAAGAAAGLALYWFLFLLLAWKSGGLTIGSLFAILFALGGAFSGWKVGEVIQGMVEAGAAGISKSVGAHDQAVSAFRQLTVDVDRVLAGAPRREDELHGASQPPNSPPSD